MDFLILGLLMTMSLDDQKKIEQFKCELEKQLNDAQSAHEVALEDKRQEFRGKEIVYTEAGHHIRSLNQFMWQVPGITIAVTGGLWYGVSLLENNDTKQFALIFLAVFDFLMILVLLRLRDVLDRYFNLQKNSNFEKQPIHAAASTWTIWSILFAWTKWKYLVVGIWSVLLCVAGILSMVGAIHPERLNSIKLGARQAIPLTIEVDRASHAEILPPPVSSVSSIVKNPPARVTYSSHPHLAASSVEATQPSVKASKATQ
jgi:hypothetical protein